ncbi:tryptophan synthase subunit beta [Fimbriimonas ginsengisoli]|uniref:Tryptophan synthase beta chain n=1 Tax=Fimbriimonas ginsengisoli Gsoil 348 TaxID=661478 RepID=A0A068NIW1_FIMGI|nr:tryptophan synthase subunit beta [Fimbriimonas ginsengisoli]AIE83407.1 tryptophan synthase subunit beta [Fimbriimonas ginsengisoli Gsoil 348]
MLTRPDSRGRFGAYGGRFVPETLIPALEELEREFDTAWADESFKAEFRRYLSEYVGRPTPITEATRISEETGLHVVVKREDLNHTGAHKINNALGQCLLALRMGKKRIIAETGAGQHGVATATVCALFGLQCEVYMGEEDTVRQQLNVFRMKLLGAKVHPVSSGTRTLKDALNEAMRDWVTNVGDTHYIIGTAAGPHPYPYMVREFQRVIGDEARAQYLHRYGRLPDCGIACVGGGSNAIGFYAAFLEDPNVRLIGVEAGGHGILSGEHAAPLSAGTPGVLHGSYSYMMQDEHGQVLGTHSVSAGLDYPGVGAEHSYLKDAGRVVYMAVDDEPALQALQKVARLEGLIPAFESAHAFAPLWDKSLFKPGERVLVNMSGRGDKDMESAARILKL